MVTPWSTLSQEVSKIHLGLDVYLLGFLCPPPLSLRPSLPISFPPPPFSNRGCGVVLAGVSAPPDPAGGCIRGLLRTSEPHRRRSDLCLCWAAATAPAWGPGQGLVSQSQHGVEGLRSVPGRPHPLLVLSAAGWGTICVSPSPNPSEAAEKIPSSPAMLHLLSVCSSTLFMDVSAAVFAGTLPKVPCPAARGSSGLPGVERTLSGMVQTKNELGLSRFARWRTFYFYRHWQRATVGINSADDVFGTVWLWKKKKLLVQEVWVLSGKVTYCAWHHKGSFLVYWVKKKLQPQVSESCCFILSSETKMHGQ